MTYSTENDKPRGRETTATGVKIIDIGVEYVLGNVKDKPGYVTNEIHEDDGCESASSIAGIFTDICYMFHITVTVLAVY